MSHGSLEGFHIDPLPEMLRISFVATAVVFSKRQRPLCQSRLMASEKAVSHSALWKAVLLHNQVRFSNFGAHNFGSQSSVGERPKVNHVSQSMGISSSHLQIG